MSKLELGNKQDEYVIACNKFKVVNLYWSLLVKSQYKCDLTITKFVKLC